MKINDLTKFLVYFLLIAAIISMIASIWVLTYHSFDPPQVNISGVIKKNIQHDKLNNPRFQPQVILQEYDRCLQKNKADSNLCTDRLLQRKELANWIEHIRYDVVTAMIKQGLQVSDEISYKPANIESSITTTLGVVAIIVAFLTLLYTFFGVKGISTYYKIKEQLDKIEEQLDKTKEQLDQHEKKSKELQNLLEEQKAISKKHAKQFSLNSQLNLLSSKLSLKREQLVAAYEHQAQKSQVQANLLAHWLINWVDFTSQYEVSDSSVFNNLIQFIIGVKSQGKEVDTMLQEYINLEIRSLDLHLEMLTLNFSEGNKMQDETKELEQQRTYKELEQQRTYLVQCNESLTQEIGD